MSGKYDWVYKSRVWRAARRECAYRAKFLCGNCGAQTLDGDCHHLTSLKDGGAPYDQENLAWWCRPCHRKTFGGGRPRLPEHLKKKKPSRPRWVDTELRDWRKVLESL